MNYVVVIPTCNRYEMCLRAIRSAFGQSLPPSEVFVVDDASTDQRYLWLEEVVNDPRLTVFRKTVSSRLEHATGYAIGAVRNVAIRHTLRIGFSGWVAFLDDDDEWMPTKTAEQMESRRGLKRYGLICSNAYNRTPEGVICGYHHEAHGVLISDTLRDVASCVNDFNPVINSTAMIHTSLVEWLGDQQATGRGEDWDYWRRASRLTGILRIEEPLAYYTIGNVKEYR